MGRKKSEANKKSTMQKRTEDDHHISLTKSYSKSFAMSSASIGGADTETTQTQAMEMREERRQSIQKTHKYIFQIVGHYFNLSNEVVEEYTLDEEKSLTALTHFVTKEGTILIFQYQKGPELSFSACGRSYANMSKDGIAMRMYLSGGIGQWYQGKVVFVMKKNPVLLDDRNIIEEIIPGTLYVDEQQGLFGALAAYLDEVYKPGLDRLKRLKILTKPDPNVCQIPEFTVALDNFTRHFKYAEHHIGQSVWLAELDDLNKMTVIDSMTDASSCVMAAQSKNSVEAIEELATIWCQQVEKMLVDSDQIRRAADDVGPKKELEYWLGQTAKFNHLIQQLREKRARMVLHTLHIVKSNLMARWHTLDMMVTDRANEARDNTKYLYTMEKYCEPLYRCEPAKMIDKLPGLFGSIRLIFNFSRYYNSASKVSSIIVQITNQIVSSCKAYLSDHGTTKLWDLPRNDLKQRLSECLLLFQGYINTYNMTKKKIANNPHERKFNFSAMYMFGKIYTFRTRIEKITSLFDFCDLFQPLECSTIEGIDTHCARFNSLFNNLRKKGYDLLNYRNQAFEDDMDKFLDLVAELKVNLQKFMVTTLKKLKKSLDTIRMIQRFDKLNLPFLDIEGSYASVIQLYNTELDAMLMMYERDKEDPQVAWNLPPVVGKIYWVRQMLTHIGEPILLLQKIRPSVMKTPEGRKAIYRYNRFAFELVKAEVMYHLAWFQSVDMANNCLQVPILTHAENRDLVINFDPFVFEVIKEAQYMAKLNLQIPRSVIVLIHTCEDIHEVFTKLQLTLVEYKILKESIPDVLIPLMQPTMFKIDTMIFPALHTISWTSLELNAYFKEIQKVFDETKILVKTVCDIKFERIDARMQQVADSLMCTLPTDPMTVEEFIESTRDRAQYMAEKINKTSESVRETVLELMKVLINQSYLDYRTLESLYNEEQKIADPEFKKSIHTIFTMTAIATISGSTEPDKSALPEDLVKRDAYIETTHNLFEECKTKMLEAILKCVRSSLSSLRKRFMAGSSRRNIQAMGDSGSMIQSGPFFEIFVELAIPNVITNPKVDKLMAALNSAVTIIVEACKKIVIWEAPNPAIYSKLDEDGTMVSHSDTLILKRSAFKSVSENKDVMKYASMGTMAGPLGDEFKKVLKNFATFAFIWTDDREQVVSDFAESKPELTEFREKNLSFRIVEQDVCNLPETIQVGAVSLNTEPLKRALMVELSEWRRAYGKVLQSIIKERTDEMAEYISTQTKILLKNIKDLDDIRAAMGALNSVKENYIRLDEQMTPIEEAYNLINQLGVTVPKEDTDRADSLRYGYEKLMEQCGIVTDTLLEVQPIFTDELTTSVAELSKEITVAVAQ